jgi:hypothetical protein
MRFIAFFALVCLTLALGCNKKINTSTSPPTSEPSNNEMVKMVAFGEVVSLARGEAANIEKTEIAVTFMSVASDNRCPRGVNCITEGEAFVQVSLGAASAQRVRIDVDPKRTSRVSVPGATIEFLGLDPYPEARVKIAHADRRLRVRIKKSSKM